MSCILTALQANAKPVAFPAFYPADVERGKSLSSACLACHGPVPLTFGAAAVRAPKLGGQRANSIFDALLAYQQGARRSDIMRPIAAALPLQDKRDVAEYLAGAEIKPPPPEPIPASWARSKVHDDCAACHGETGLGVMHGYPVIGGQYQDYLVHALVGYQNGERKDPTMVVMARKLTRQQIVELAAYFDFFASRGYLRAGVATAPPVPAPKVAESRTSNFAQSPALGSAIVLVDIPAGDFLMGSNNDGFQGGSPQHRVHVPAFRMARYDVTFAQFDAFVQATGAAPPPDEGWGRADRPVVNIDWAEIQAFIAWLNKGSRTRYRLPSEAEWEYAARAGTQTTYWWGDEPNSDYANTAVNTGTDVWEFTSPVGRFPLNPFGLADMLGNVWQVVADCRHLDYRGAPQDGHAWLGPDCDSRIVRGGYFSSTRIGIRSFTRAAAGEHFHSMGLGFRVAADAE